MVEYHFPIPGSEREKEIIVFVRRHWVSFLGQFLLSTMLLLIPIIIIVAIYILRIDTGIFQGVLKNIVVLLLSAYYLVAISFAFVAWMTFYYNCYIVTRQEIIEITQVGFFGREISQLPMLRVQDVTSSVNGFLPSVFSYGDVLVETASEQRETTILCSIPNPQEVASKIMNLHDEVIETEGRHHQILEGEGTLAPGRIAAEKIPEVPETSATPYREMLEKEKSSEGQISQNDLEKGGEIEIK